MIGNDPTQSFHVRPHPQGNLLHTMPLVFVSRISILLLLDVPDHHYDSCFWIPQSHMMENANLKPNTIPEEDISNSCLVSIEVTVYGMRHDF